MKGCRKTAARIFDVMKGLNRDFVRCLNHDFSKINKIARIALWQVIMAIL
jgi:hypothetical protein